MRAALLALGLGGLAACGGVDDGVSLEIRALSPAAFENVTKLVVDFHPSPRTCDQVKASPNVSGVSSYQRVIDLSGAKTANAKIDGGLKEGDYAVSATGKDAMGNPVAFGCTATTIKTGEEAKLAITVGAL